jgi:hypothetical protein
MKRIMHFEVSNFGLVNCVAIIKIFTMIFVSEDFLWMISIQKIYYIRQIIFRIGAIDSKESSC